MPVFSVNGKRVLFMHVPKAGGTTVEQVFSPYPTSFHSEIPPAGLKCTPQHLIFRDMRVLLGGIGWDYGFAVVRDPYKRVESEYRFRTEITAERYGKTPDFSLWLSTYLDAFARDEFLLDNHFRPQAAFVSPDIDVFRLEDGMESILARVSEKLGVQLTYDGNFWNETDKSLEIKWDPDILERFNSVYAGDFSLLGYEKRSPAITMG